MTQTIVLVDDDRNILTSVQMFLEAEGFAVRTYPDGDEALRGLLQQPPDLAVLDIKMPRLNGMELLQKLRQNPATAKLPVIFLTSKDEEIDEIMGLRMGADDYIRKPFAQRLFIERIRSLLRREQARLQPVNSDPANILARGNLVLDLACHICTWKGKTVDLTETEFMVTKALAQHPGHVKSRDQLMDVAYGDSVYVDDRSIDSHIKRIRRKFRETDNDFGHIESLYGVGYRYKED